MTKYVVAIVTLVICATAFGDVRLPTIFSDNMILQQNSSNAVWGWADPGETVTVKASWGAEASAKTGKDGKWKVLLETPGHGMGYSLTVSGTNTVRIRNVAIGEVWLCAGQSNMGWALRYTFGGEEEAAKARAPGFRIYKSLRRHWFEPLEDCPTGKWTQCTPQSAGQTSAVSYYFGKTLHEELGIPVGIIVQAYAGTPIEAWMPYEIQQDNPWSIALKKDLDARPRRLSKEAALAKYEKELKEYKARLARGETGRFNRPLQPPNITHPAPLGHQYPGNVFNAMIHPIRPYGIRGVIWYQGERNAKNPWMAAGYRSQLALLIKYYRRSWHELSGGHVADDFPFFFTQLPSWGAEQQAPVEGDEAPWAVSREMMRLVAQDLPNTGMVVSIDTGDAILLHPRNKKPIGLRHAYLALEKVYGKHIVGSGPVYRKSRVDGGKVILEFDSVGSGLMAAKPGRLDAFAIAGRDRKWHWADAAIEGDTVVVSSPKVPHPVAVRYAWAMNPSQRNLLYNKEGLPASPFRTDDWPLFERKYEVRETTYNDPRKTKRGVYQPKDWKRPAMTQLSHNE